MSADKGVANGNGNIPNGNTNRCQQQQNTVDNGNRSVTIGNMRRTQWQRSQESVGSVRSAPMSGSRVHESQCIAADVSPDNGLASFLRDLGAHLTPYHSPTMLGLFRPSLRRQ